MVGGWSYPRQPISRPINSFLGAGMSGIYGDPVFLQLNRKIDAVHNLYMIISSLPSREKVPKEKVLESMESIDVRVEVLLSFMREQLIELSE